MDMSFLRRLVGLIVLLLSMVGTVGCSAGILGTWIFLQGVSERVQRITDKLDAGLRGKKSRLAARTIRSFIQQQASPNMDELGGRLATLSDCAIAVSSLLESYREVPLARVSRIDSDRLKSRADEARRVSSILRRLEVALGDGDAEPSRQEVAETTSAVDLFLQNCKTTVSAWQSNLDETRDDLARVKATILD